MALAARCKTNPKFTAPGDVDGGILLRPFQWAPNVDTGGGALYRTYVEPTQEASLGFSRILPTLNLQSTSNTCPYCICFGITGNFGYCGGPVGLSRILRGSPCRTACASFEAGRMTQNSTSLDLK